MMIDACKNWRSYKGRFKPRCNNGYGCMKCWSVYNSRRYAKSKDFEKFYNELKTEAPDWFEIEDESELVELCWTFFMRGLELNLGAPPK